MICDEANRTASAAETSGGTDYYCYAPDNKRIYRRLASGSEEWTLYGAYGEKLAVYSMVGPTTGSTSTYSFTPLRTGLWFTGTLIWEGAAAVYRDAVGTNRAGGARFYPYGDEITSTSNDRSKFATYDRELHFDCGEHPNRKVMLGQSVFFAYDNRGPMDFHFSFLKTVLVAWFVLPVCVTPAAAQGRTRLELARLLANDASRRDAISFIAASRGERVPLLLDLATNPPSEVDEHDLRVGLAEAFGQLKTAEAIPFLTKNLVLRRELFVDLRPWLKIDKAIEDTFPAIGAMILIGPEASRAVMRAYDGSITNEERLAAIFVVSHVRGVPEAEAFLKGVVAQENQERHFAEEGLSSAPGN